VTVLRRQSHSEFIIGAILTGCDLQSRRPLLDDGVLALQLDTGTVDKCAGVVLLGIPDRVSEKNSSAFPAYLLGERLVDVFAEYPCRHEYLHEKHWVRLVSGADNRVSPHKVVHLG
jgi:hypothetical protein